MSEPAYQPLAPGTVARTVQLSSSVLIDLDTDGYVLGMEALDRDLAAARELLAGSDLKNLPPCA